MSQTAITFAFEQWKAQEAAAGKAVVLDEFVLAYIPGLDHTLPIDRAEKLPPAAQIVHRQAVNKIGLVNDNAVVYSVTLGTEIGDFDFNWLGLVNKASGTVAMIVHAPTQRKVANATGQQGNVLTRSFLMEYNGAATATGITTPAETWQIDFTARLTGIDEMQRLINVDNYGPGAFFGAAYLVAKNGAQFFVTKGTGYISGIRADLPANRNIAVPSTATKVWADVSLQGNITSQWEAVIKITVAPTLANYSQSGFMHYVFAVASIDAAGNITDLRPKGSLTDDALAKHEQSRNHPDGTLLYKGFVQLDSATDSSSELLAATPKAVKIAMDNASARLAKDRNGADIPNVPLFRQNLALKGAALVDIGKVAGTAAAGDDSRIVEAISIKDTNIQLPGNVGVKNLQVHPMPNSTEGGQIDLYDKSDARAAFIDIDSAGNFRVVVEGLGVALFVSRTNRDISMSSALSVFGDVRTGNGAAWLAADGNVYGPAWGGYLSTYISNQGLIGPPLPWPQATPPAGYLKCNGASFNKTQYPKLALAYPSGVLPDMRGNVIRGWDDGRGIDPGRGILTEQGDAIRNITGTFAVHGAKELSATFPSTGTGAFSVTGVAGTNNVAGGGYTTIPQFNFSAANVVPTANENRMRNIAFNYIVRAL
ncbi:phage tail protein [Yersinia thracica]|uniref:phage tail-collar fiber domain-containing protein n=1 Tax=Yersinia thracica TaxID=2890319 RepID=UPI001F240828|nr:phage tail protein [Yersinia thracica]